MRPRTLRSPRSILAPLSILAALSTVAPGAAAAPTAPMAAAAPVPAGPVVLERIVAVVGREVILLSELRARLRPHLDELARTIPNDPARRATVARQLEREVIDRLIDERLEAVEATRVRVSVAVSEIDAVLVAVAKQRSLTVVDVLTEARKQGMSEAEFRDELRRQILDEKLSRAILVPRIRGFGALAEADREARLAAERFAWLRELRGKCFIEVRP